MPKENHQMPIEHKLLIEFIYQKERRLFKRLKYVVQNKPVKFGLRIKNIEDKISPRGRIRNLSFESAEGGNLNDGHDEEFSIPELNPGQEKILWWPNSHTMVLKGLSWVACKVEPEDRNRTSFVTFQCDTNVKKLSRFNQINAWADT